ncbi:Uncharacterized protein Adt_05497 [Abeliophyllum distichum]|uniref:Ubiquitinyl hydrolase 1 n=1 Tax=Abeliophyllum distichum TaxID=126358 RepID=A0ABD1V4N5_9LAMI
MTIVREPKGIKIDPLFTDYLEHKETDFDWQGLEQHYETSKDLGLLNVLLAFEDCELDKIVSLVKGINLETGETILVAKSEGHTPDSFEPIEQNDTDSDTSDDVVIHERFFCRN